MNAPDHPHRSVRDQIADTERAIWAGNERLAMLREELTHSVRQRLQPGRKQLVFGVAALVALGAVMYPRRHKLAGKARSWGGKARSLAGNPIVSLILGSLPVAGGLFSFLGQGRSGMPASSGLLGLLLSWLPRLISSRHATQQQHQRTP